MAELIITMADGRTVRHRLGAEAAVIGRDENCDIPLSDPSSSRRHARFSMTPRGYMIEDLGSKNGTLVNDLPCTTKILKHGDEAQIGASLIVFQESGTSVSGSVVISDDKTASHGTHYVSGDRRLALSQKRLEMIYELSGRLVKVQSQDELFENAMDICSETLHFERGAIGIKRRGAKTLDWPVIRNLLGSEGEITVSRTLLSRALEYGERAIFTEEGGTTDPTVSMVQQGIRSAMCVPLIHNEETLGVIYGDRISTSTSYTNEDIDFLAGIAQQVSIGLINARLVEDQREMVRLNHDIDLARSLQFGLFPLDLPDEPNFKIGALNDPGMRVSGDYYDVIPAADGRTWFLIADVTGEGVAAAFLMANLQAAVHTTIEESYDPAHHLDRWNRLICRNTGGSKFITCLLLLIDPKTGRLEFASAGHHPPLLIRPGQDSPDELATDAGFPLGVVDDAEFISTTVELGTDPFLLLCYTDGVIEAMDNEEAMFGAQRLHIALTEVRDQNPKAVVTQIRKQVSRFADGAPQSDDITVLAVRLGATPG